MSELSLQARIEARLAKHKQQQSSLKPSELIVQQSMTEQSSTGKNLFSNTSMNVMSNTLHQTQAENTIQQRELTQTRSKMMSLERQTQNIEQELKNKDQALRKTLAEATGERVALVEALTEARALSDNLKIDLTRKDDLIQKLEQRLSKQSLDFEELQVKLTQITTNYSSQQHDIRFLKEQINMLETKSSIQEKENEKLTSECDEYRDQALENKVLKNKVGQIDHEYQSITKKYKNECENNLSIRAELVQLKQEYSEVLNKFANYTDEYEKFKRISAKYDELSTDHDKLVKKHRQLTDDTSEVTYKCEKDSSALSQERQAAQMLGTVMKQMCSMQEGDIDVKFSQVEDTVCYMQIQPILLKLKQIIDQNKLFREDNSSNTNQLSVLKRDNQKLQSIQNEFMIKTETLTKSNDRLNANYEELNKDLQSAKVELQNKENQYNKLVMECQLAIQTFGQRNSNPEEISKVAQNTNSIIVRLQKEVEVLNQEIDELALKYNGLEQNNQGMKNQNQQLLQELEISKKKYNSYREESGKKDQDLGSQQSVITNLAQFIALCLRQINQLDKKLVYNTQINQISNISLNNYIQQYKQLRELVNLQEDIKVKPSKADSARKKLRKMFMVQLFINKLKIHTQITQQTNLLERKSIESVAQKSIQFGSIISSLTSSFVYQSGDIEGHGIAFLSNDDRNNVLHKVLSRCFQDAVVFRFGTADILNLQYGKFNQSYKLVNSAFQAKDSLINELALQNSDVLNQHELIVSENDQYRNQVQEMRQQFLAEQQRFLQLQNNISQNYVIIQDFDELQSQNKMQIIQIQNLEQKITDIMSQNSSMNVEISSYQNEISRLNTALQSSDQLVKTINTKFEEQMRAAVNMRELVSTYEKQLKQKDLDVNEKVMDLQRLHQQAQQLSMDEQNLLREIDDLRKQLRDRDQKMQEIQYALDKESRLRILAENSQQQKFTQQTYQRPPMPVSTRMEASEASDSYPQREFKSAVNKGEIQDLLKQLNQSLGDE
ncbi:hypothetical protein SS50377_23550 [Spironucleus salmonicida]|uniref:Uncharacterized protein n=1 Tax=Spironucleus salmonicida TaxID=348837 RepID=V6LV66_9EUKA|nr:hypothetical protein SS50377_23550 [Spironucleus salmonicida]|eukprot:EST48532.1 hypothetical protein SS50377_11142 [Spironucleus salmonicida]